LSSNWNSPLELDVRPDANVLIFTTVIAISAGIGFGVLPAFRSSGVDVVPALKENAGSGRPTITALLRGHFRLGNSLVIGQMVLSVLVLVVASLLVHTLINLKNTNPGFDTHQTLLFSIDPVSAGYKEAGIRTLYQELQNRLVSLPGVTSVSYSSDALLIGHLWTEGVQIEGQETKANIGSQMLAVGPRFFVTMRIPVLSGRAFLQSDLGSKQRVVIINQAFAKKFFPGRNPLGLHITRDDDKNIASEIVGIVGDTKYAGLRDNVKPIAYVPIEGSGAYFELRTNSDPNALIPAVRRLVAYMDSNVPILNIASQSEMTDRLIFNERMVALLSTLFAALALVLVCMGLYGLLSYEVSLRTREIGIRTALGAPRGDVLRLVVGQGIGLALIGVGIGIVAAIGATRYLQSFLYGIRPNDPLTFVTSGAVLIVVGLLACNIPARRATKVDPMVALRYE
jgi:predicted permease